MRTAKSWLDICTAEMTRAGVFFGHGTDNARDEAAWMVLHVLGESLDGGFKQWNTPLSEAQEIKLEQLLNQRINKRWPLAYLTGEARFCGLDFTVSPDVLVPRSPLAELIQEHFSPWLDLSNAGRILDMCTGGGCIAIAIAKHMPSCDVDAVDISPAALEVAAMNASRHEVESRVRLIRSDLFSGLGDTRYDLIVSNPPYVSREVFEHLPAEYRAEPSGGLVCGEDGLDIVLKILDASPEYMNPRGILIVEVGESAETLLDVLPRVPFLWLEFENGGDGVFLLEYDQLIACRDDVRRILEQRNNV
jgi:ribosomal protein L3 glutamine methyltransferase